MTDTSLDQSSNSQTSNKAQLVKSFNLSTYNTMSLSCIAEQAVILDSESQIEPLFEQLTAQNLNESQTNLLILSGGSNVILPESLNALAVMPRYTGLTVLSEEDTQVEIEVMAGNNWHDLVVECTQKGWYGLENLALIPGLVGASPVQNIGAYGVQLEDCLTYVKAFHLPTLSWQVFSKAECQFAYRDSIFKQHPNTWLISRVGFRLHKDDSRLTVNYGDVQAEAESLAKQNAKAQVTPLEVMQAVINIRQSKLPDPKVLANTGSFFQNPIIPRTQYDALASCYPTLPKYDIDNEFVKVPAGWLIDQAGLKGEGIFPILTHEKQALVLTNHAPYDATKLTDNQAKQADIANTRDLIINTVQEKYGIELHPEPVWID